MRVVRGVRTRMRRPLCLAVGVFDGVHLGHRAVIATALRAAQTSGTVPAVLMFDPHPDAVLNPDRPPLLLTTTDEKLSLLRALGIRLTVIATFDQRLADMPPDRFVRELLADQLRAQCVVVGENWRFGAAGKGTPDLLHRLASALAFRVFVVPPVTVGTGKVSSTRIRHLLAEGRAGPARELLGRPYQLAGRVVAGHGLGRQLGYPTANLQVPREKLVPADGIYACRAGRRRLWPAVSYIGVRPTFHQDGPRSIEAHLLERGGRINLLGRRLRVEFVERLRRDRKFSSPEALAAQMARDCARARRVIDSLHD